MPKQIKFKRSSTLPLTTLDSDRQVSWEIDSLKNDEQLGVESSDPAVPFSILTNKGDSTTDNIILTYTGTLPHQVPYSTYVYNGSRKDQSSGYLVIDTIGPPTYPLKDPQDHGGGKQPAEVRAKK